LEISLLPEDGQYIHILIVGNGPGAGLLEDWSSTLLEINISYARHGFHNVNRQARAGLTPEMKLTQLQLRRRSDWLLRMGADFCAANDYEL
jgi:hypothetical protein